MDLTLLGMNQMRLGNVVTTRDATKGNCRKPRNILAAVSMYTKDTVVWKCGKSAGLVNGMLPRTLNQLQHVSDIFIGGDQLHRAIIPDWNDRDTAGYFRFWDDGLLARYDGYRHDNHLSGIGWWLNKDH
jgi:hypothetical protein